MEWYFKVWKDWQNFSGRATRTEYWTFTLYNLIIIAVIAGMNVVIDTDIIDLIYSLAVFVPALAVSVRRLHDTGRSGWWILIFIIPLIGFIVLVVFYCQDSRADNQYGKNPKAVPAEDTPAY
jgi:uncharacterized membrane protein YhaH (DUF805 family)